MTHNMTRNANKRRSIFNLIQLTWTRWGKKAFLTIVPPYFVFFSQHFIQNDKKNNINWNTILTNRITALLFTHNRFVFGCNLQSWFCEYKKTALKHPPHIITWYSAQCMAFNAEPRNEWEDSVVRFFVCSRQKLDLDGNNWLTKCFSS